MVFNFKEQMRVLFYHWSVHPMTEFRISDILYNLLGPLINYVHIKFPYDPSNINKSSNYA